MHKGIYVKDEKYSCKDHTEYVFNIVCASTNPSSLQKIILILVSALNCYEPLVKTFICCLFPISIPIKFVSLCIQVGFKSRTSF